MRRRAKTVRSVSMLMLVALWAAGCAEQEAPVEPPAAPAADEAEVPFDLLPPPETPSSPWPEGLVPLSESVAAFETFSTCVSGLRQRVPVELAEAFSDIGYDQLLDDVCHSLAAQKSASADACAEISTSSLERACRRRVALLSGQPDACPSSLSVSGREAICLAWALRDASLCQAASPVDRLRCRAVLDGEERACRRERPDVRSRCEAEVARYGPVLAGASSAGRAAQRTAFRVSARVEHPGEPPREPTSFERDVLDRGVFLRADGCQYEVALEDPTGERPAPVTFRDREPSLRLRLRVPALPTLPLELPMGVHGARVSIVLPGVVASETGVGAEGAVTLTRWSTERGGVLAGRFTARLPISPGELVLQGEFRTYVRDLEGLRDGCQAADDFQGERP